MKARMKMRRWMARSCCVGFFRTASLSINEELIAPTSERLARDVSMDAGKGES